MLTPQFKKACDNPSAYAEQCSFHVVTPPTLQGSAGRICMHFVGDLELVFSLTNLRER